MWLIALFLRFWNWSPEWRTFLSALKHKVILKTNFRKVSDNCHQQGEFPNHLKSGSGASSTRRTAFRWLPGTFSFLGAHGALINILEIKVSVDNDSFSSLWFRPIFCFPVEVLHSSLSKEALIKPRVLHCCTGFNRIFPLLLSVFKSQISLHLSSSNKEVCTVDVTWHKALRFAEPSQKKQLYGWRE